MKIAITRQISPRFNECELTHLNREPINLDLAHNQHRRYESTLQNLGLKVLSLPAEENLPDSVFVEDTAIVLDECAIITRPGADSRKPELETIVRALSPYRQLFHIQAPGTVDGGDVLVVGKNIYVGDTSRSNLSARQQMQTFLAPFEYTVIGVPVTGCLHLKSAVTLAGKNTLLINPAWVDKSLFPGVDFIEVDPSEPSAANALLIGERLIYSAHFPKTQKRLEQAGFSPFIIESTEVAKAEGALTCCSLVFEDLSA